MESEEFFLSAYGDLNSNLRFELNSDFWKHSERNREWNPTWCGNWIGDRRLKGGCNFTTTWWVLGICLFLFQIFYMGWLLIFHDFLTWARSFSFSLRSDLCLSVFFFSFISFYHTSIIFKFMILFANFIP